MKNMIERIEDFIWKILDITRKLIIAMVLTFIGLFGLYRWDHNHQADLICQRDFGPNWTAITHPGDTYGAYCKGPNGQMRWSRPRSYQ